MLKYDKLLIINIWKINEDENNKYVIFIAINIYNMDIDNLDYKF